LLGQKLRTTTSAQPSLPFANELQVFTFSMHEANNYPLLKGFSDLDIGLPGKTDDEFYLKMLDVNLENLLYKVQPDFIFFQSGVDVLTTGKLGKLGPTRNGCKERGRIVLRAAKDNAIPLVVSMG